ncbi:hypothetical protein [Mesorhizobium sp. WSM3864]|uniref:hypothetical protein n=2 Tax=unclassified Mesorhizobium TaxID=325217 RepID=UPI001FE1E357|nr:hypothetical protein [Mesorhizobium sp. WSM3864]
MPTMNSIASAGFASSSRIRVDRPELARKLSGWHPRKLPVGNIVVRKTFQCALQVPAER